MLDLDSSMRQTLVSSFIYDQERERSDASHESGLKKDEPSDFKGSSKLDDSTYSIVTQQADRYSKTKLSLDTNINSQHLYCVKIFYYSLLDQKDAPG